MKFFSLFLVILTLNLSCKNTKASQATSKIKTTEKTGSKVTEDEETFNSFQFKVPENWQKTVSDFEAVDLNGNPKTIETDYQMNRQDIVRLVYHPGENGVKLFEIYQNSRRKNLFQTAINKMPAVKLIEKIDRDGKGHLLKNPMTRTKFFILHPAKKGSLEIVFDLKDDNRKTISEFDTFLKSLQPIL